MARTKGAVAKRTIEFAQLYDELVAKTGVNPVEVLFKLCKSRDKSIRRQAAADLMPYRYAKQAAVQVSNEPQTEFSFSWDMDTDTITGQVTPDNQPNPTSH